MKFDLSNYVGLGSGGSYRPPLTKPEIVKNPVIRKKFDLSQYNIGKSSYKDDRTATIPSITTEQRTRQNFSKGWVDAVQSGQAERDRQQAIQVDKNIQAAKTAVSWRAQASNNPTPVLEAMDNFNYRVQGLMPHTTGVNENGRNTIVDFIGSVATVAAALLQAKTIITNVVDATVYNRSKNLLMDELISKSNSNEKLVYSEEKYRELINIAGKLYQYDKGTPGIVTPNNVPVQNATPKITLRGMADFFDAFRAFSQSGVPASQATTQAGVGIAPIQGMSSGLMGGALAIPSTAFTTPPVLAFMSAMNTPLASLGAGKEVSLSLQQPQYQLDWTKNQNATNPALMTREQFVSPVQLPVASSGNVIVYHVLYNKDDLASVQRDGLLISKKPSGAEGPSVLWGTTTPTGYTKDGVVIGMELPASDVKPVAGNQYQILRDVSPNEIVYVDRPGFSSKSSGLRINEERASKYASKYYDAYVEDAKANKVIAVNGITFNVTQGNPAAIKEFSDELALTPSKFSLSPKSPEELANATILYSPTEKAGAIIQKADYSYYADGGNVPPNSLEIASVFRHGTTKGAGKAVMTAAINQAIAMNPDAPIVLDCFNTGGLPRFYETLATGENGPIGFKKIDEIPYDVKYATDKMKEMFPNGDGPSVFIMQLDKEAWLAEQAKNAPPKPNGDILTWNPDTKTFTRSTSNVQNPDAVTAITEGFHAGGEREKKIRLGVKGGVTKEAVGSGNEKKVTIWGDTGEGVIGAISWYQVDGADGTIISPSIKDLSGQNPIIDDPLYEEKLIDAINNHPELLDITGIGCDAEFLSSYDFLKVMKMFARGGTFKELPKGHIRLFVLYALSGRAGTVKNPERQLWSSLTNNFTFKALVNHVYPDKFLDWVTMANEANVEIDLRREDVAWKNKLNEEENKKLPESQRRGKETLPQRKSWFDYVKGTDVALINELSKTMISPTNAQIPGQVFGIIAVKDLARASRFNAPNDIQGILDSYPILMVGPTYVPKEFFPYQPITVESATIKGISYKSYNNPATATVTLIDPMALQQPLKGMANALKQSGKRTSGYSTGRTPEETDVPIDYSGLGITPQTQEQKDLINSATEEYTSQIQGGVAPKVNSPPPKTKAIRQKLAFDSDGNLVADNGLGGIDVSSPDFITADTGETGFHGIDLSNYDLNPPTEQVVSAINGSLRPGYINITSVAHLVNTPARTLNALLNNDPLKIGLDKMGAYDLLYGKETNAELRLGQGNPSVWNFGFVPATVKSVMLWGELFAAQTRMTFKDITVEADLQRDTLIGYDRDVAKLSKDEFVQMLWDIKRGGSGMLPTQGASTLTKTQELADRYIAISKRAQDNLIAAGLDPQIFARLQGHYLPAPSDELGKDILPTIDEKMTVKPSLGFIEKQQLPQDVVIGMASQDDTWQDYRDYMVARMAAEIRAGEKGRFFGAIAADPHTNAISPNAIDYNTGKKVSIPKDYVVFSLGGEKKSFALDGYAVPRWVALFINNEFTGKAAMEQMKVIQEVLGQWKWNKAIANIPTFVRNVISQLTFQSLESGLSVLNMDDYVIRPLGALLGLNKADQQELIKLGILDSGLTRDLEGLGFSPQERALWQSGQDRGLKLGMVYDKLKTVRNLVSSVYSFSDNFTKAGAYYAARRNFDPRTARILSSLTTGDYSQRPPIVNYLTRGIYNGHINPFAMAFSSPFAFFKLIVEPQRVGNLIRFHPSLLVAGLIAAALGIKGLIKKLQREYGMSEAAATALVNQFENYYWLNGKYVIPTGKNEGVDVTSMIPMLNFIAEAKKALVAEKTLSQIFATANSLVTGVNSANFILETLVSFSTGNDLNYFLQYGALKSIGKTNVEQLLWLVGQMSPTWLSKLLIKKKGGKDFSLDDLIGQYKLTLTEAEKNKAWYYIRTDPNIALAEKKRTAAAFFGPNSLEQIGWERITSGGGY